MVANIIFRRAPTITNQTYKHKENIENMEWLSLIPCIVISIYLSVDTLKHLDVLQIKSLIPSYLGMCLILPVLEESFFRGILKPYGMWFNILTFEGIHGVNYLATKRVKTTLMQMILTTVLGYVCFIQDTVWHAMMIHILYNVIILTIAIVIHNQTTAPLSFVYDITTERIGKHRYAMDDFNLQKHQSIPKTIKISIPENKMTKDMLHRYKQL